MRINPVTELTIDYERLADAIANKLARSPKLEQVIWDTSDCARYLKCSRKHFTDRVCKQHGFPKPSKGCKNRWLAGDVIAWASQ